MIVLHQFTVSPFCDKVRRVLAVKGQPYETRDVAPSDTLFRLRRLNPAGKLPVLEHDGRVIADSTAIVRYLEETFPEPPLLPGAPRDRALARVLEDWADESLYFYEAWFRFGISTNAPEWTERVLAPERPALKPVARALIAPSVRLMAWIQGTGRLSARRIRDAFREHVMDLAELLDDRAWLVGDALSVADIAVAAQVSGVASTPDGRRILATAPRTEAWLLRVNEATAG
ncbi:MAG: glutathione S-transferase family protein [Sandaracinaceae bacterium]